MTDTNHIIDKIAKLMRLAERAGTPEEAATAFGAAQRLAEQHKIALGAVDISEQPEVAQPEEPIASVPLDSGARLAQWRIELGTAIASANGCRTYISRVARQQSTLVVVGRPSDQATVGYMMAAISRQIDAMVARDGAGKGRTWATDYRLGCVSKVRERLQAARREARAQARAQATTEGGTALARIDRSIARLDEADAAVKRWMDAKLKLKDGKASKRRIGSGYAAGRAAGDKIGLGGGRPLGAGQRAIST
jgi:hypothetical protein